ncbi:MAG: response regulator [Euryarchaeota archaeon]|nr:response regulator [Euryarchaeota archaeon]
MDKKIMIVDDDPDLLVTLRMIFEQKNYEVLTVDSGQDCIDELERGFKGIILMDIMMPFMDGWTTLRHIVKKGLAKDVVFSIITAHGSVDKEKMKGLESYIYDYIAKPFDVTALIKTITSISTK